MRDEEGENNNVYYVKTESDTKHLPPNKQQLATNNHLK